jgi:hypothetical protein
LLALLRQINRVLQAAAETIQDRCPRRRHTPPMTQQVRDLHTIQASVRTAEAGMTDPATVRPVKERSVPS